MIEKVSFQNLITKFDIYVAVCKYYFQFPFPILLKVILQSTAVPSSFVRFNWKCSTDFTFQQQQLSKLVWQVVLTRTFKHLEKWFYTTYSYTAGIINYVVFPSMMSVIFVSYLADSSMCKRVPKFNNSPCWSNVL